MATATQQKKHEQWLMEVTGIPTAAGCEQRVVEWVLNWAKPRKDLQLKRDGEGNIIITQKGRGSGRPLFITAHLDHPAFVVREVLDAKRLELEFRGGVHDPYFQEASLEIFDGQDTPHRGRIQKLDSTAKPFKRVIVDLTRRTDAIQPGDVGRWAFRGRGATPTIHKGILHTPACDDLAAVAAALSVLDLLRKRANCGHVGVLLTVAEEVGFIGAIAACKRRSVPKNARLICLENSRSFPESPIGGGPIIRVGDKITVFGPTLTNRIAALMADHQKKHTAFIYQRKLMAGGSCEASVFSEYGFESTCLCLPLGNYHNMADIDGVLAGKRPAKVGPEYIAVSDYHGLIEMLVVCALRLDDDRIPPLRDRLESLYANVGHVTDGYRKR